MSFEENIWKGTFIQVNCTCVFLEADVHAKWLQSCLTLSNPMDSSSLPESFHGIFQARILEWVAMPSSRGSSQPRDHTWVPYISCIGSGFFSTRTTWETPRSWWFGFALGEKAYRCHWKKILHIHFFICLKTTLKQIFIYWATLGLSCGRQHLRCVMLDLLLQHRNSLVAVRIL